MNCSITGRTPFRTAYLLKVITNFTSVEANPLSLRELLHNYCFICLNCPDVDFILLITSKEFVMRHYIKLGPLSKQE